MTDSFSQRMQHGAINRRLRTLDEAIAHIQQLRETVRIQDQTIRELEERVKELEDDHCWVEIPK